MTEQELIQSMKDNSLKILKEHDNLNLDKYKKHQNEFQKYNNEMFNVNVFNSHSAHHDHDHQHKVKRNTKREYEVTKTMLET